MVQHAQRDTGVRPGRDGQEGLGILDLNPMHPSHYHCLSGCEKSAGVRRDGELVCIRCGEPFVPCTPETCPETFAAENEDA
jgi:hypothetical protein